MTDKPDADAVRDYAVNMIRREVDRALNPHGMSLHSGKVTLDISHVQRALVLLDAQAQRDAARAEVERLRDAYLERLSAITTATTERDAALAEVARLNEMWHRLHREFTQIQAERDAARAEVADLRGGIDRRNEELAAALRERDALRADAERYRYLIPDDDFHRYAAVYRSWDGCDGRDGFNRAIDRAIAEQGENRND